MSLIDPHKKYDKFVTFGCSYSNGHELGVTGSWGYVFSKLIDFSQAYSIMILRNSKISFIIKSLSKPKFFTAQE